MPQDLDLRARRVLHDEHEREGDGRDETRLDADEQREEERAEHLGEVLPGSNLDVVPDIVRRLDENPPNDE